LTARAAAISGSMPRSLADAMRCASAHDGVVREYLSFLPLTWRTYIHFWQEQVF